MPNLPHFPEVQSEISVYLSWDKEFIALAKKSIQIMIYTFFLSYFLMRTYYGYSLEAPHNICLNKVLQMSTHNMPFSRNR